MRAGGAERRIEVGRVEGDGAWVRDAAAPDRIGLVEPKTVAALEAMSGG